MERAPLEEHNLQFSYRAGDEFNFMNTESYEMVPLSADVLGDAVNYLIEGMMIEALYYEGACRPSCRCSSSSRRRTTEHQGRRGQNTRSPRPGTGYHQGAAHIESAAA